MTCDSRLLTGPHRGERCLHPARWRRTLPGDERNLCGYHARAYTAATLVRLP